MLDEITMVFILTLREPMGYHGLPVLMFWQEAQLMIHRQSSGESMCSGEMIL